MLSKSVGISGATGFIGKHVVNYFKASDVRVVCYSRRKKDTDIGKTRYFNMGDSADVPIDFSEIKAFIHLAGAAHGKDHVHSDVHELVAIKRLLEHCLVAKVEHFIFVSSAAVYGSSYSSQPINVAREPAPVSSYGRRKLECEKLVEKFCLEHKLNFTIIRIPLVIGQGAPGNLRVLEALVTKRVPLPLKSVENKRSVLCIEALSDLLVKSVCQDLCFNQILFVCMQRTWTIEQILLWIAKINGIRPAVFGKWKIPAVFRNNRFVGKVMGDLVFAGADCVDPHLIDATEDISIFVCHKASQLS